jgi:hypothetical protein
MWVGFVKLRDFPAWTQWMAFLFSLSAICFALFHILEAPMIQLGNKIVEGRLMRVFERRAPRVHASPELQELAMAETTGERG